MRYMKSTFVIALVVLLNMAAAVASHSATADEGDRSPDLPSPACDFVQVEAGNQVTFHAYAVGVQRYRWNGTSWSFVEPVATLYADAGYQAKVGIHYVGPTWESNSGSKVVAARRKDCSPDPTAIPWLKLQAVSTDGPGIFSSVTWIQRVNTVGGVAPAAPGSAVGAIIDVPYTAEYYFYSADE